MSLSFGRLVGFLVLSATGLVACSVVFNFDSDQCTTDLDCTARGGQFAKSTCVSGVCASSSDLVKCKSNAECTGPALCKGGACVKLTSAECPIVAGESNLRSAEPIVFGAYGQLPPLAPAESNDFRNYELAIDEFNGETGGLLGGPNGTRRPFAAVTCQFSMDPAVLKKGMDHLVHDVGVAGVVAALEPDGLRAAFETSARDNGVFMLGAFLADSGVVNEVDDGLLWNLQTDSQSTAAVYKPLVAQIEQHLALGEPMRVVSIEGTRKIFTDIGNWVSEHITFSGAFQRYSLPSADEDPTAASKIVTALLTDKKPHLIISLAGEDFLVRVLPQLESAWPTVVKTAPPFYVLSEPDPFSPTLVSYIQVHPDFPKRALGVNVASAADKTLYNQYISRFKKHYPDATDYEARENFYDAPYMMMYAYAGAGTIGQYTGADLNRGIKRLLDVNATTTAGTRFSVGPDDVAKALFALGLTQQGRIGLWGALGPPDFDEITGTRKGVGSIWCVCQADSSVVHDAMRYDQANDKLVVGDGTSCCPFQP